MASDDLPDAHILVVDDDERIRELIRKFLVRNRFLVTTARDADHPRFARYHHAMLDRGVYLPPSGYEALFLSAAHPDGAIEAIVASHLASLEASSPA